MAGQLGSRRNASSYAGWQGLAFAAPGQGTVPEPGTEQEEMTAPRLPRRFSGMSCLEGLRGRRRMVLGMVSHQVSTAYSSQIGGWSDSLMKAAQSTAGYPV